MKKTLDEEFGIHYSSHYLGSDHFFKRFTTRTDRNRISIIAKVPCFNSKILIDEVNKVLRKLDIECIDVLQLWGGNEVLESLNPSSQLYFDLQTLKYNGKIKTFLPQLYYQQTIKLIDKTIKKASIAFYGSPFGIDIYHDVLKSNILSNSVAMHIHGGGDFSTDPVFVNDLQQRSWYALKNKYGKSTFSLAYLSSLNFISKVVGSTRNISHFEEIINFFRNETTFTESEKILTQQVAIQNSRFNYGAPLNVENTWPLGQNLIRERITYFRLLGSFHALKHEKFHIYLKKLKIIPAIFPY
jgi:hypothetical protein